VLAGLLLALLLPVTALAHRGGLDVYGCHPDDKAGGYHCHQGVLVGLSFRSRGDMLAFVENWRKAPFGPPATPQAAPPTYDALTVCTAPEDQQRPLACFNRITPRRE
jgi:hypothetical protein